MRQIGTIASEPHAHRLVDYLLTLGIKTQLRPDGPGWAVWVQDEDRVQQAQGEMEHFVKEPSNPKFQSAAQQAAELRRDEVRNERTYQQNEARMARRMAGPTLAQRPLTIVIIAACLFVAWQTQLGNVSRKLEPLLNKLLIASIHPVGDGRIGFDRLGDIQEGQVWRLVTPIFIHFGWMHLIFNMLMFYQLGSAVELRRGPIKLVLMILVMAVSSNLAQYYIADLEFHPHPIFGGMSGVLYGLFGYIWMKSRFDPWVGLFMPPNVVMILMIWLVVCMTGIIGSIANTAHVVGLLVGVVIGVTPYLARKVIGRR